MQPSLLDWSSAISRRQSFGAIGTVAFPQDIDRENGGALPTFERSTAP